VARAVAQPYSEERMEETLDRDLAERVDRYIEALFAPAEAAMDQALVEARDAGLPAIHVSANEGKLLYLIARMVRAERILEIGTLGGFSATWLARALPANGRVVTLEVDQRHADVARKNLDRAGVGDRVEIRVGRAAESLSRMIAEREAPFDVVFIDADKESYLEYLDLSVQLTRIGSVILADNLIRGGRVLEASPSDANAAAAKKFNAAIARHPRLESIVLPIIRKNLDGLSISIVR
jgi:caffeoyl-CoA O-methyltransferase